MFLLIQRQILLDQGPTLTTSFDLNYFLFQNRSTLGVRASVYGFGGNTYTESITVCIFFFSTLKMQLHCLLVCYASFRKSAVIFIFILLYICPFPWPLGIYRMFCTCEFIVFNKLKFSQSLFLQIPSLSVLMLYHLVLPSQCKEPHATKSLFIFFFWLSLGNYYCYIFNV